MACAVLAGTVTTAAHAQPVPVTARQVPRLVAAARAGDAVVRLCDQDEFPHVQVDGHYDGSSSATATG